MARFMLFVALFTFSAPNVFAQLPIGDLFQVNTAGDIYGGCYYANKEGRLDQLVRDSVALADYGLQALEDYNDPAKPEAKRLIDVWYINPTLQQRQIIESKYRQVKNWLMYGGPVDGARVSTKPWLFCFHNWLQRMNMIDVARDNQGNPVRDLNNNPVRIYDIPKYKAQQEFKAKVLNMHLNDIYPYWSHVHNAYIFDQKYGAAPTTGICSNVDAEYAQTTIPILNFDYPTAIVTLCPSSFGTVNTRPRGWEYKQIGSSPLQISTKQAVVDAILSGQDPKAIATVLETPFGPTAATLFHELFHVVLGREASMPRGKEQYKVQFIFQMTSDDAILNPETFVLVALAYSYTLNSLLDAQGNRVEFYSGFATQG